MSGKTEQKQPLPGFAVDKSFSVVRGHSRHRYIQNGVYYDFYKNPCGPVAEHYVAAITEIPDPKLNRRGGIKSKGTQSAKVTIGRKVPTTPKTPEQLSLERATASLGDLGLSARAKGTEDPERENARALAAEGQAE